jgi:hypothetical protein
MRDIFMADTQSKTNLKLFYQNVRGVRTKIELSDNAPVMDFETTSLTETWLDGTCFDYKLFPDYFTSSPSDRINSTKRRVMVF